MTTICAISDLHGHLTPTPPCDLLVIAGDVCPTGRHDVPHQRKWIDTTFREWLERQPATEKIGIMGNHDFVGESDPEFIRSLPWTYLENESAVVQGIKVWGSPMTPTFFNWAYMAGDHDLASYWEKIPDDVEIVITHGPPYGIQDRVLRPFGRDPHVGSQTLRNRLIYGNFPNLRAVIFGHIHEGYGSQIVDDVLYINASHVDHRTRPGNPYFMFAWSHTTAVQPPLSSGAGIGSE